MLQFQINHHFLYNTLNVIKSLADIHNIPDVYKRQDNCYAACQLGKSFLKLLSIEIRGCFFDLLLDLADSCLDFILAAFAVNDNCIFFLYLNGCLLYTSRCV